jgi:hypothetical protein
MQIEAATGIDDDVPPEKDGALHFVLLLYVTESGMSLGIPSRNLH